MHGTGLCRPAEHLLHRRQFLGTLGAGAAALANLNPLTGLCSDAKAKEMAKQGKSVIIIYLGGGASQFETWDPKPGRPTGGPYGAIATSVPGLQISELLPQLSTRMHHMAVVRSVNNHSVGPDHHGTGAHIGRRPERSVHFPTLAEMVTKELSRADTRIPPHVELQVTDTFRYESQFGPSLFGSAYAAAVVDRRKAAAKSRPFAGNVGSRSSRSRPVSRLPQQAVRTPAPGSLAESYTSDSLAGTRRHELRRAAGCRSAPQADLDRYGPTPIARHCLLARRLVEAGVSVVKIRDTWWDTHADNFEGHRSKCANLDHALSLLLDDLVQRDMLGRTLVLTLSEFGRTPTISRNWDATTFPTRGA